jgi:hypothetical protein
MWLKPGLKNGLERDYNEAETRPEKRLNQGYSEAEVIPEERLKRG